ncbi:MAG: hypothetical protein ACKV2U_16285 [Bryobacteraceae bacterium]
MAKNKPPRKLSGATGRERKTTTAKYQPIPPNEMLEAFQKGIDTFLSSEDTRREELKSASPAGVAIYTLALPHVAAGKWTGARAVGWRLVTGNEAGTEAGEQALADIATGERHPQPRMVSFYPQAQSAEFIKNFREILETDQLQSARGFGLRLLRIPALLTDAFWIRSPDGMNDTMVPILASATMKKRPYAPDEFLRALQPLVKKFLAFDKKSA